MNKSFFKRRWFEFRLGYATYLTFVVAFSNFILLLYNFSDPTIRENIPFEYFIIIMGVSILGLGILFGMFHLKKQFPTEAMVSTEQNPYFYKIIQNSKEVIQFDALTAILTELEENCKDPERKAMLEFARKQILHVQVGVDTRDMKKE
jgi:hypothetical protein